MKAALELLGRHSLEASGVPGDFDGEDLINALLILQHVAHSISWQRTDVEFNLEQRSILCTEFGKNIRQSVMLFTGLDPHEIVGGNDWPEVIK